ncbi:TIGR02117 family protein [Caballeronia sp. ATUFL_M2_KS44]|uniref:TIGR02117 family protein n=1 Tax=Caballeronia sp. ATUFL_M2_KS44 TaxID=2921767 RepID=UPI0020287983|nr:TIGR02117 family protein [Caballeronia sp. ATUFL_M2_KS44]
MQCAARALAVLLCSLLAYALAALVAAVLPVNRDWQAVAPDRGVTIWLTTNGVHTALLMPRNTAGVDWTRYFSPADTRAPAASDRYDMIEVGWGDREFFLNTPEWKDLRASTAFHALAGLDGTVLHVEFTAAPRSASEDALPVTISHAAYGRLAAHVTHSLRLDASGKSTSVPAHHYDDHDAFYEAHGNYSAFSTCNQWTRDALNVAGVRVPAWTPFDRPLFWQLRGKGASSASGPGG